MKAISYPDVRVPENIIPSHTAFRSQDFSTPVWLHTETSKSTKRKRQWTVFYYSQAKLILVSKVWSRLTSAAQVRGWVPAHTADSGAHSDVSNQFLRAEPCRALQPLTGASTFETCYFGFVFVL